MAKEISINGIIFLRQLEGCRLKAYPDSGGVWTIGVGNTYYEDGSPVKKGDVITQERADYLLRIFVGQIENYINNLVKVPLTQNQFDALVAHIYNIGYPSFKKSTMLKLLNAGEYGMAADQILRWNRVDGQVNKGLVNRTIKERELFLKPD